MKTKLLIISNAILLSCVVLLIIYFNWDKFFQPESVKDTPTTGYLMETFVFESPFANRHRWLDPRWGNNLPSEKYIQSIIDLNPEKAVEIFKTLIVSRWPEEFLERVVFPLHVLQDDINNTYVILAHFIIPDTVPGLFPTSLDKGTYRFEISRSTGAVVNVHLLEMS